VNQDHPNARRPAALVSAAPAIGGRLEAVEAQEPEDASVAGTSSCQSRVTPDLERRPANALNIEIGQPLPRCINQPPAHWGDRAPSALRWIGSGGSPLVFGACSPRTCPLARERELAAFTEGTLVAGEKMRQRIEDAERERDEAVAEARRLNTATKET